MSGPQEFEVAHINKPNLIPTPDKLPYPTVSHLSLIQAQGGGLDRHCDPHLMDGKTEVSEMSTGARARTQVAFPQLLLLSHPSCSGTFPSMLGITVQHWCSGHCGPGSVPSTSHGHMYNYM